MKLLQAALFAFLLFGCSDDPPTAPEPECVACYLVTLADGTWLYATTVNRDGTTWHIENECTGEEWTINGTRVRLIGALEEGCEE